MAEAMPNQLCIFVSHSSSDNAFCGALVDALRATGADVWYDQHNLRGGQLLDTIVRELKTRPIFIVIVSEDAFTSEWVPKECRWAWGYYLRDPARLILLVVVRPVQQSHWDNFPYLDDFTRIEGPNHQPYPQQEAIERTLKFLSPPAPDVPAQNETHGRYCRADALSWLRRATLRRYPYLSRPRASPHAVTKHGLILATR